MTEDERDLLNTYGTWTAKLHKWLAGHLKRHLDVEFVPDRYEMHLYTGYAQERNMSWGITVPGLDRPPHEAGFSLSLPRPEDNPTQAQLDETFRSLCLAAARLLEIDLHKPKLQTPATTHEPPQTKEPPVESQPRLAAKRSRKRSSPDR